MSVRMSKEKTKRKHSQEFKENAEVRPLSLDSFPPLRREDIRATALPTVVNFCSVKCWSVSRRAASGSSVEPIAAYLAL
jgi:hypothetical protein